MRNVLVLAGMLATVAGCGGGGGGGTAPATTATTTASSSGTNAIAAPADNVQPIVVDPGPRDTINIPFVSVTVCAPRSGNCQTIDHVIVDTASTGLRIVASVLSPALSLAQQTDSANNAVVECAQFASGFSWGPVKIADVKIAGLQAASVPIQIIGDSAFATVPAACSSTGPAHNSVQTLSANGILGVSFFRQDCGDTCVKTASVGFYYACSTSGACQQITLPLTKQVQNPVALFASDNNGVIVQLPAIPATGAATVTGALVFGIGTRSNNALAGATVFPVNPKNGRFTTVYKGQTLTNGGFVDTGSNALFFPDSTIPRCSNSSAFYCPSETLNLSGTIQGTNGTTATINFTVANTNALLQNNPSASAFNNLGGPSGLTGLFDWGLPFYFGRNVYSAFVGSSTPAGAGPYIAF